MPTDDMPDWTLPALKTGLQQLLCLGLEGQPSADVIAGTLLAWHRAITRNRMWDRARDEPRFEAAFVVLAERSRRWPAPADFLDALPAPKSERPPLRLVDDAARRRGMAKIAEIAEQLGLGGSDAA